MVGGAQLASGKAGEEEIRLLVRDAMRLWRHKRERDRALDVLRSLDDDQAVVALKYTAPYLNRAFRYLLIYLAVVILFPLGAAFIRGVPSQVSMVTRHIAPFLGASTMLVSFLLNHPTSENARSIYARLCRKSTVEQILSKIYIGEPEFNEEGFKAIWMAVRELITDMNRDGDPISPTAQHDIALRLKKYWPRLWMAKEARLAAEAMLDPSASKRLDKQALAPLIGLLQEIPFDESQRLLQASIRAAFPNWTNRA